MLGHWPTFLVVTLLLVIFIMLIWSRAVDVVVVLVDVKCRAAGSSV